MRDYLAEHERRIGSGDDEMILVGGSAWDDMREFERKFFADDPEYLAVLDAEDARAEAEYQKECYEEAMKIAGKCLGKLRHCSVYEEVFVFSGERGSVGITREIPEVLEESVWKKLTRKGKCLKVLELEPSDGE